MVLSSMAFWLFFITLLYIPMRQTLCELPAPHPREPHCAQKDFRDLHAVFPRAAAVSCTSGPLRMSTGVCKRGFGPNGKLPQAVCCLIVTVDSETAVWKDVKGNACVKIENSTTSGQYMHCFDCLFSYLLVCVSVCLSRWLSVCPAGCPSVPLFVHPLDIWRPPIYLFFCSIVCSSVCFSVCLSVCLSMV